MVDRWNVDVSNVIYCQCDLEACTFDQIWIDAGSSQVGVSRRRLKVVRRSGIGSNVS